MVTSQNGYPANDRSLVSSRQVPGTTRYLTVRKGAAGDLLLWVAGQFDRLVEDIEQGVLDDWGYAERTIRGDSTTLSNHASGTAIDLDATAHPLGTEPSANYTPAQIAAIHAIVGRTEGCVRWGGDYTGRKDGMHFEIVAPESRCAQVLAKLTSGEDESVTPEQMNQLLSAIGAVPKATWNEAIQNALDPGWSAARDILRFGHFEAGKGRRETAATLAGLQAALAAATKDPGITEERLTQIINAAIEQHVQITGTVEIGSKP